MTEGELVEMTSAELIQIIHQQEATIACLEARVAELEVQVTRLKSQLEEAQRAAKRQAAPFSKGPPKTNPKRPGRKAGHAPARRSRPKQVHRVLEAELPPECPFCGGELTNHRVEEQFVVDLPPVEPIVTPFNVHIAGCAACGRRVQGRHPEQISEALGAAAVQMGPRVLGLAAELKHGMGVPYRKIEGIFSVGYGLEVSPGGLARGGQRLARQSEPTYRQLIQVLGESAVVNADETSWKIAGEKAWLWVFTNQAATVDTIDPPRAHDVVERVLGKAFDEVDATNNLAERRIRPAVIVRKISAGNRSNQGFDTHTVLTSLIQTCRQQDQDFLDVATELLRNPQPRALDWVAGNRQDGSTQPGHGPVQPLGP